MNDLRFALAPAASCLRPVRAALLVLLLACAAFPALSASADGSRTRSHAGRVHTLVGPTVTRGPYLQLGTATGVIVRWRTDVATDSRVRFGTAPDLLGTETGDNAQVTDHSVTLSGLASATRYYYSVGSSAATLQGGADDTFRTAPPIGTAQPTRVWVLGDSGTKDAVAASVRDGYVTYAAGRDADVFLMLGDNAYETGSDAEYQAAVFSMYPAQLSRSVLWSTIGNHDTAQATNPPLSIPYFQIFDNPINGAAGGVASGTEKYYSFDYGRVHFICLDSMTSSRLPGSPMLTWLESDLGATTQDWIIVFFHHPPYSKGSHDSDTETELVQMRANVLPILEAGGVDLVLAGHSHSYERSVLLNGHYGLSTSLTAAMKLESGSGRESDPGGAYDKSTNLAANQGAVYVVAGNGGHVTNWVGGSTAEYSPAPHPAMYYSALHVGSLVLDVNGNRLDARLIRPGGSVDDAFTILKTATLPQLPAAPTNLVATSISRTQVNLAWNDNAGDETAFLIERSTKASSGFVQVASVGANVVAYSNTGLSANKQYYFRVRASNGSGASTYSNVAGAKTRR